MFEILTKCVYGHDAKPVRVEPAWIKLEKLNEAIKDTLLENAHLAEQLKREKIDADLFIKDIRKALSRE